MSRPDRSDARGFTLVEVLISIVLAGIISGVAAVGVTRMFAAGPASACASARESVRVAAVMHDATLGRPAATIADLVTARLLEVPRGSTVDATGRRLVGDGWQVVLGTGAKPGCHVSITQFPLDRAIPSPAAAYGLRLLTASYEGPAIRVVRSSDSTSRDIGFTSDGRLDTAALLSFVGSGSGAIDRWYDQTGRGAHATQAVAASRPLLVVSGVLQTTTNGSPQLAFNGLPNGTMLDTPVVPGQRTTWNLVATRSTQSTDPSSCCRPLISTIQATLPSGLHGMWLHTLRNSNTLSSAYIIGSGPSVSPPRSFTDGRTTVVGLVADPPLLRVALDGTDTSANLTGNIGTDLTIGGERSLGSRRFAGGIAEVVLFNTALTPAELDQLEATQAAEFGFTLA
jgi:prepilin-type N-terminal cleavage/methylation domain-containing protein